MNYENDFPKDIVTHVAEMLLLKPTLVELNIITSLRGGASATIWKSEGEPLEVNIDPTQIDFYEILLEANGIDVKIAFMSTFP